MANVGMGETGERKPGPPAAPNGLPSVAQVAGDAITFNLRIAVVEHMDGGLPRQGIQGSEEIPQRLKSFGNCLRVEGFRGEIESIAPLSYAVMLSMGVTGSAVVDAEGITSTGE